MENKNLRPLLAGIIAALFTVFFACKKDDDNAACYNGFSAGIRPIINSKCAVSGCHVAGTPLPDFTIDSNVKVRADNGRIRSYIFDLQIMPPASAEKLTDEEKAKIKCWLDDGAPQN